MQRHLLTTKDGSHTVVVPEMNVTYHSHFGALQESLHVFIEAGFKYSCLHQPGQCNILEVGFGTGLNALLTLIEAQKMKHTIYYVALEPNPLSAKEAHLLNYCELLMRNDLQNTFIGMHQFEWNKKQDVNEQFQLFKLNQTLQVYRHSEHFNLVYFDAFAPAAQPELWTKEIFDQLFTLLKPGGILVTYCSKGEVRRAMKAAGFMVNKIPGPPGKREIIRAQKEK